MSKPFIILSGAIKNIGDFLIFDRAKKLLNEFVSDNLIEYRRDTSFDHKISELNSSRGIIICGGPGFSSTMYPNIYALTSNLKNIQVPIIPLGVGWSGKPKNEPEKFNFSDSSRELMDYIDQTSGLYSCRDEITKQILIREKYEKVIMTGCPVWYDIKSLGKEFSEKKEVKKIVFTTPADRNLFKQTIKLLNLLKRIFPKSEIYISFHRGIKPDKYTGYRSAAVYMAESFYSKWKGFKVVDTSFDLKKIDFYNDCDLHIGFRVHAHLFFLSKRLPSILISEDGRGSGMAKTFNLPDFFAFDPQLTQKIEEYVKLCLNTNFGNMKHTSKFIDDQFPVMHDFLNKIKNL